MLSGAGMLWWTCAPLVAKATTDPRMPERNPDHFSKLVRFYRLWGTAAIAIGLAIAVFIG